MCNEAACITDRMLPNVPVRQWVLSVPFDLCALVAAKPDVRTAVGRIFAEEIVRAKKRLANVDGAETGVVSCHQSFGGSLNAHAHWHDVAVDGVFDKVDEGVRFHKAKAPDKADIEDVVRWLRRHGCLDERPAEERGNEGAALSAGRKR